MSRTLRLGAVSYLNTKPLVYGLETAGYLDSLGISSEPRRVSVRFDVPAICAERLARGEIDLGLVPSITYTEQDRIVPGVSIASDGAVASVALFSRRPVREIRTLALDTSSRTSVALTRVLCRRRFEIAPTFVPHAPDLETMLAVCDAALLIGDPALFVDHRSLEADKIDLGETWTSLTGLPFVWAVWVGRAEAPVDRTAVQLLQAARDAGVANSDAIADTYAAPDAARQQLAREYLRTNIQYGLGDRMLHGLRLYYREAADLGLISAVPAPRFF